MEENGFPADKIMAKGLQSRLRYGTGMAQDPHGMVTYCYNYANN